MRIEKCSVMFAQNALIYRLELEINFGFHNDSLYIFFQRPEMGAVFMPQFVDYTERLWYDERKSAGGIKIMKRIYVSYKIDGLEYCKFNEKEIKGINKDYFEDAKITQGTDVCTIIFLLKDRFCTEESIEKEKNSIIFASKRTVKQIICELMIEDFDINRYSISEPSFCIMEDGCARTTSSITIKSVNTKMEEKDYQKDEFNVSEESMNEELENIIDILEVPDQIVRYEFLFEKLKKKCNNSQKAVIEKIMEDYPQYYAPKHNIDHSFWGNGNKQEWQDDFSFLRTLISHGKAENFEEINESIERDTNNIVKVLSDLCK